MKIVALLIFLSYSFQLFSQEDWKLVKESENISVYTQKLEHEDLKQVKIDASVKTSMHELVAALEDIDSHKDWVMRTLESKMVDKISEDTFYYYIAADFPFPARDRDLVVYYERWQDPETKIVYTKSTAAPSKIPSKDDFIRMDFFSSTYKIIPKEDGWIDIEYYLKTGPGGKIPNWMINLAITKGPIDTIESLFELLATNKYSEVQVEGIIN